MTIRRTLACVLMLACCGAARADLTCVQLEAIGRTTIQLRDRGSTLSRVMADVERSDMTKLYTPEEMAAVRQTVRMVYTSEFSVEEIIESCTYRNKPKG